MSGDHFGEYQYRAPSALQVAARANDMEKKLRLQRGLAHAEAENERYAEPRLSWFFQAVDGLKKAVTGEKLISRAATERRPIQMDVSCAECPR